MADIKPSLSCEANELHGSEMSSKDYHEEPELYKDTTTMDSSDMLKAETHNKKETIDSQLTDETVIIESQNESPDFHSPETSNNTNESKTSTQKEEGSSNTASIDETSTSRPPMERPQHRRVRMPPGGHSSVCFG